MGRAKIPREVELKVTGIGEDGHGTGLHGERGVRIKNGLPGETVTARVLRRRAGEWLTEAITIEAPASERQSPPCRYFPRCGGCVVQHLEYSAQLSLKEAGLREALHAEHVPVPAFEAPVHGPRFHYRTKARFGVRVVSGEVLVGFRESFSNRVGRMNDCLTLTPALSALLAPLKILIGRLSFPDRIPQVEVAAGEDACAFILRHLEPLTDEDKLLIADFAGAWSVRAFTQSGGYDTVTPASVAAAEPYLSYLNEDYGLHFLFRPMDFTQVNLAMNRKLVRAAIAGLAAPTGARVLDLFCGIGNFSLALAATGLQVTGLEAAADAIVRAELNAGHNGLSERCEFAVQDLYDADCLDLGQAEFILLDPPRSGAGPNLAPWLEAAGAKRIAYVSCSPKSFAADAAVLKNAGFELERLGIYDMFPNTAHVETLGIFQKRW